MEFLVSTEVLPQLIQYSVQAHTHSSYYSGILEIHCVAWNENEIHFLYSLLLLVQPYLKLQIQFHDILVLFILTI